VGRPVGQLPALHGSQPGQSHTCRFAVAGAQRAAGLGNEPGQTDRQVGLRTDVAQGNPRTLQLRDLDQVAIEQQLNTRAQTDHGSGHRTIPSASQIAVSVANGELRSACKTPVQSRCRIAGRIFDAGA
jgi:hypothetical protein